MEENTLFSIADLLHVPVRQESKYEHEYQQMGVELQKIYGRGIWKLFHTHGFTETKIRRAHEICKKKGILKLPYLIGCVNNDKGL